MHPLGFVIERIQQTREISRSLRYQTVGQRTVVKASEAIDFCSLSRRNFLEP